MGSALLAVVLIASACDPSGTGRVELPIGNSTNYLGTGQLWSGADRENRWLAVSGVCASREQGDRFSPISDGNYATASNPPSGNNPFAGCAPGSPAFVEPNPEHRAGYLYAFEVPEAHEGALSIDVFDAPNCSGSGALDSTGRFPVQYTVYGDDGAASGVLASLTVHPADAGCNSWRTIHTVADALPGTYVLQVQAVAPADLAASPGEGSNSFALRAGSDGEFARCTDDPQRATETTSYGEGCVTVSAIGGAGTHHSYATSLPRMPFEVGSEHGGGTLELELWDVGEGARRIQIIAPDGTETTFRMTVLCLDGTDPSASGTCAGETNPTGGRSIVTSSLDVSGNNHPQPRAHRLSSSRYNDRLLRLEVDLPDDLDEAFAGSTWWNLQVTTDSSPQDRTTISAFVRPAG